MVYCNITKGIQIQGMNGGLSLFNTNPNTETELLTRFNAHFSSYCQNSANINTSKSCYKTRRHFAEIGAHFNWIPNIGSTSQTNYMNSSKRRLCISNVLNKSQSNVFRGRATPKTFHQRRGPQAVSKAKTARIDGKLHQRKIIDLFKKQELKLKRKKEMTFLCQSLRSKKNKNSNEDFSTRSRTSLNSYRRFPVRVDTEMNYAETLYQFLRSAQKSTTN